MSEWFKEHAWKAIAAILTEQQARFVAKFSQVHKHTVWASSVPLRIICDSWEEARVEGRAARRSFEKQFNKFKVRLASWGRRMKAGIELRVRVVPRQAREWQ